jgi:UDP-glucose 4-epimerase
MRGLPVSRVLITGGAGTLGRAVASALIARGIGVRSIDVRPIDDPPADVEMIQCDIRDRAAVNRLTKGVMAVVHAAAWHGIHLRDHPASDFWELNVDGTFNVFEAAASAGVRAVVFSSTMGVYGESSRPVADGPAVWVTETLSCRPTDIYATSKVLGEELAAYYARSGRFAACALRYGMFVPEPFLRAGIRFLYGGVDPRDVATAVVASLDRLLEVGGWLGAFNVESALPFEPADRWLLREDPLAVLTRHWPDAAVLLERAGAELWGPIGAVYVIDRARRKLGWQPRYGFAEFLAALRSGRENW